VSANGGNTTSNGTHSIICPHEKQQASAAAVTHGSAMPVRFFDLVKTGASGPLPTATEGG